MKNCSEKEWGDLDYTSADARVPFPMSEYERRLTAIRKEMEKREIDLLYVTNPENLFYISGLNSAWLKTTSTQNWNEGKAMGIAVHVDSDEFILFDISDEEGIVMNHTCCRKPKIKAEIPQYIEQDEDILTYALFPQPALAFFQKRQAEKYKLNASQADFEHQIHPI